MFTRPLYVPGHGGFFGGFIDARAADIRFKRAANAILPFVPGPRGGFAWSNASGTATPIYTGNYSPQTHELTVLVRAVRYGAQPDSGFGMAATLVQVSGTQDPFQLFIKDAGERIRINTVTDDTVNSVETSTDWPTNRWQTGVYAWASGTAIDAYRDGVKQTLSLNTYSPGPSGALKPATGLRINNGSLRINGAVGAVLIWGRKLNPAEIFEATGRVDYMFRRRVFIPVSTTGINAALTLTDETDTLSAAGSVAVSAAFTATDATDPLTAAASVSVNVALTATDTADSLSAAGSVVSGISADFTATDSTDAATIAASVAVSGAASINDSADTLSASGGVAVSASALLAEASDVITFTGTVTAGISAAIAVTDSADTLSAVGSVAILAAFIATDAADSIVFGDAVGTMDAGLYVASSGRVFSAHGDAREFKAAGESRVWKAP